MPPLDQLARGCGAGKPPIVIEAPPERCGRANAILGKSPLAADTSDRSLPRGPNRYARASQSALPDSSCRAMFPRELRTAGSRLTFTSGEVSRCAVNPRPATRRWRARGNNWFRSLCFFGNVGVRWLDLEEATWIAAWVCRSIPFSTAATASSGWWARAVSASPTRPRTSISAPWSPSRNTTPSTSATATPP